MPISELGMTQKAPIQRPVLRRVRARALAVAVSLTVAGAVWSCSSTAPPSGQPVTRQVVTAAGGQVSAANGRFKMQVPPGALKQDTAITIRTDPPAVGAFGPVYEVGPTGTQFQRSVTLSLSFLGVDFGGADPDSLHVATLSGGRWVPVTSTTDRVSLAVTGQITHLSPWTLIVYTDVVPPEPEAGTGGDLDAGVGGDVAAEAPGDAPEGGPGGHDAGAGSMDAGGTGGAVGGGGEGGGGQSGTGGAGQGGAGAGGQSGAAGSGGAGGAGGQSGAAGDSGQGGAGGQGGGAGAGYDAATDASSEPGSDADTTDADMSDGGVDPDAGAT